METEILFKDALAGIFSAKLELREIAQKLSRHDRTILHIASKDGSIEQVRYILKEFAADNFLMKLDSDQETALHVAAYYGHTEVVNVLIEAARSSDDVDPLHPDYFLQTFVRHANSNLDTALHLAVAHGNLDCTRLLVEADKSHRHIQNSKGETPVYLAAALGYNDTVKMICETCTTPNLDGPDGSTALHAAIKMLPQANMEDREDVVKVLVDAVKRSMSSSDDVEAFVRQSDENMETALHLAVQGKHSDAVRLILKVDPTYPHEDRNMDLKTPIYLAAEQGFRHIVRLLCETTEFGYTTLGPQNRTALHAAIIGSNADCVGRILERAPYLVTYGDNKGWTPLHYAAEYKFDSVLEGIIEKQNLVEYQSVYGYEVPTPLCIAVAFGNISTVKKLMALLPWSCSEADHLGQNILHIGASRKDKEMVQCILKYCPKDYINKILNAKDVNGDTPLHLLIREGCFVPELINHKGADILARNKDNWTPFDMLYSHDRIKSDQLQIKKAVDGAQANHRNWKLWRTSSLKGKSNMQESDIEDNQQQMQDNQRWIFWRKSQKVKPKKEESLVPPDIRSKKEVKFKRAKKKLMKQELQLYRTRTNTQIIVTALITTVTFTVGFTLPGGYHQSGEDDQGLAVFSKKRIFTAFMVTDALALVLSTSSLFLYFVSTMYQTPHRVSQLNAASTVLNIVSIIAMMLTFLAGTYLALSNSPDLAIGICVIICLFFLLVIFLSILMIYDWKMEKAEV